MLNNNSDKQTRCPFFSYQYNDNNLFKIQWMFYQIRTIRSVKPGGAHVYGIWKGLSEVLEDDKQNGGENVKTDVFFHTFSPGK